jgi:outer membrane lipoprotein-sorting protein
MNGIVKTVFTVCLLFKTALAAAEAPELDLVLERLVASYGGAEQLQKLESMTQEWDFVALMGNRRGTDVRSVRIPGRLKVELTYPDKTEVRILNGETASVVFDRNSAQTATPWQRDAMRLQLMRLYSPLVLRQKRDRLTVTQEDGFCALSLKEHGLQVDYLVNQENWVIERVVGTLMVNGSEMRFRTEYSDFSFRDGVLMHGKENKFAGGVNTAVLTLRKITLDAELEDHLFETEPLSRQTL